MGRAAPCRDGDETGALDEDEALQALRLAWGTAWDFGRGGTQWQAARRDQTGHVLTRVVKDMVLRYRSMRGFRVPRRVEPQQARE